MGVCSLLYGLTGATQTCQRGLDELFRDCHDCVDNYVDDTIIFSDDMNSHEADLRQVLDKEFSLPQTRPK